MTVRSASMVVACAVVLLWPGARVLPGSATTSAAGAAPFKAKDLWLAPEPVDVAARADLARAVADLAAGRAASALVPFELATSDPLLAGYALLNQSRAQLALGRAADALNSAKRLQATTPGGYLAEAALWMTADAARAAGNSAEAFQALQALVELPSAVPPPTIQMRLGIAAFGAGNTAVAVRAFSKVYFEYPLSPEAGDAKTELTRIAPAALRPSRDTLALLLDRGERQFAGKQYSAARATFVSIRPVAAGDDRQLIDLRLAECDVYLKRYPTALAALRPIRERAGARQDEAEYHYLGVLRELGRKAEYDKGLAAFVDRGADPVFVERALNDLAQFHLQGSNDAKAAEVFADLYRRFPQGAFAERAAWKAGWWAYKSGHYVETIRIFESAATGFRRSDFRPAWLFWAARSRMNLGEPDAALTAFARVIADYRNTYYGRAAIRGSERVLGATRPAGAGPVQLTLGSDAEVQGSDPNVPVVSAGPRPDNADLLQGLLAAGMYEDALGELRFLQATGGSSPMIEATVAWALNRQGRLRPAIQTMRRAYPQFMAAGGEDLPREILTVIFPVDHWSAIQVHAAEKGLDQYLVAALIAQESTFQADIKSPANAWGLMQIVPATGRQYARRLGIAPFSTRRLIEPDVNLRLGTTYLAELISRFRDEAPALAAYNAGPSRSVRWLAERPGMDREEFIDDIPFAETQNYVKRILGAAEDYRRLYR